jgi:UPF0755 protein
MTRRILLATSFLLWGCGHPAGDPVEFLVPQGASLTEVVDTLRAHDVVRWPGMFELYARAKGDGAHIKAGRYAMRAGSSWGSVLEALTSGRVLTVAMTIPEGFRLDEMAPRIAAITGEAPDTVLAALRRPGIDSTYQVPGPGLEGYLFPDTYRFARGVPLATVLATMTRRYREVWTPERRARLDTLGLTLRQATTLASIVQAEARKVEEMPRIASVYENRLERGWMLQADPTVLYALGGYRARLLFAAIDSVADNPYNTYTHGGLPPGPIGAPGEAAIDAVLHPSGESFLYFVAWPDGTHVFTRTLAEHNRAVAAARQERARTSDTTPADTGSRP